MLTPVDPSYPQALRALAAEGAIEAPTLYLRGALPDTPGVTVVGTRAPSVDACELARALVLDLAAEGFSIWSGGARGIDAVAHEAALEAGVPTVVAMGGGLDRLYPREHLPLFARVLSSGGALLARVPDAAPPTVPGFFQRNGLLAALSVATVVIQAGLASGARSTAAAARRLGRPLCVVPHAPWDELGAGCALELARGGARAIVSVREVVASISGAMPPRVAPRRPRSRAVRPREEPLFAAKSRVLPELTPDERAVLAVLGEAPIHLDEICERVNFPLPRVSATLLTLTLGAVVVEGPAGFYRQASRP
jgi:DNA processing protein